MYITFLSIVIPILVVIVMYAVIRKQPLWIPTTKYIVCIIILLLYRWMFSILGKYQFSITQDFLNMVLVGYAVVFALENNFKNPKDP